jgi:hypothetical protein
MITGKLHWISSTQLPLDTQTNRRPSRSSSMAAAAYHFHLLLPQTHADAQTVVEFVYEILVDGFRFMDDDVTVEMDPRTLAVTLTFDQEWCCRIRWNEAPEVLRDSILWAQRHAMDRSDDERQQIASCAQRLEIDSDPDPDREFYDDYLTLVEHLQVTFDPSWTFDLSQGEFIE